MASESKETMQLLQGNASPGEQSTYHLPMDRWDKTSFAKERETAPAFDGHNSNDVLQRLGNI